MTDIDSYWVNSQNIIDEDINAEPLIYDNVLAYENDIIYENDLSYDNVDSQLDTKIQIKINTPIVKTKTTPRHSNPVYILAYLGSDLCKTFIILNGGTESDYKICSKYYAYMTQKYDTARIWINISKSFKEGIVKYYNVQCSIDIIDRTANNIVTLSCYRIPQLNKLLDENIPKLQSVQDRNRNHHYVEKYLGEPLSGWVLYMDLYASRQWCSLIARIGYK